MLPSPPLDRISFSPSDTFSTTGTTSATPSSINTPSEAQPPKRGRKSNALSRSTRETERKLSHSIIEKARRTKINKALAELRSLVPDTWGREVEVANVNFVKHKFGNDDNSEDEDGDESWEDDGEYNPRSTAESRSGGKRQSRTGSTSAHTANAKTVGGSRGSRKEKGFKLEVLERTVGYLRETVLRMRELEQEIEALREGAKTTAMTTENTTGEYEDGCSRCSGNGKRKRDSPEEKEEERLNKRFETDSLAGLPSSSTSPDIEFPPAVQSRSRLPSISSWLPPSLSTSPPIPFTHFQPRSGSTSPQTQTYLFSQPSPTRLNSIHAGFPQNPNSSGFSPSNSQRSPSRRPAVSEAVGDYSMDMTPEEEFATSSLLGLQAGRERRRRWSRSGVLG